MRLSDEKIDEALRCFGGVGWTVVARALRELRAARAVVGAVRFERFNPTVENRHKVYAALSAYDEEVGRDV